MRFRPCPSFLATFQPGTRLPKRRILKKLQRQWASLSYRNLLASYYELALIEELKRPRPTFLDTITPGEHDAWQGGCIQIPITLTPSTEGQG